MQNGIWLPFFYPKITKLNSVCASFFKKNLENPNLLKTFCWKLGHRKRRSHSWCTEPPYTGLYKNFSWLIQDSAAASFPPNRRSLWQSRCKCQHPNWDTKPGSCSKEKKKAASSQSHRCPTTILTMRQRFCKQSILNQVLSMFNVTLSRKKKAPKIPLPDTFLKKWKPLAVSKLQKNVQRTKRKDIPLNGPSFKAIKLPIGCEALSAKTFGDRCVTVRPKVTSKAPWVASLLNIKKVQIRLAISGCFCRNKRISIKRGPPHRMTERLRSFCLTCYIHARCVTKFLKHTISTSLTPKQTQNLKKITHMGRGTTSVFDADACAPFVSKTCNK